MESFNQMVPKRVHHSFAFFRIDLTYCQLQNSFFRAVPYTSPYQQPLWRHSSVIKTCTWEEIPLTVEIKDVAPELPDICTGPGSHLRAHPRCGFIVGQGEKTGERCNTGPSESKEPPGSACAPMAAWARRKSPPRAAAPLA